MHLHPVTINNSSVSSAVTFPSSVCFILSQSTIALSVLPSPSQVLSASTSMHLHPVTINNSSVSSAVTFSVKFCLLHPVTINNSSVSSAVTFLKFCLLQPQCTFILSQSTIALSVLPSPSQALSASTSMHLHPVTINNSSASSAVTLSSSVCFNLNAPSSCHNQQ